MRPLCAFRRVIHAASTDKPLTQSLRRMITVTPSACAALAELLEEADVQSHLLFRVLTDEAGGIDVSLEPAQMEDTVINFRGRNVLAVDPQAAEKLSETSLDL